METTKYIQCSASEYSDMLFRLTQLEEITGINYIAKLGQYAVQGELW